MRKLLFLLPFLALTACHAQVPPTTHTVNTATPNYTPLNSSSPTSALTFTDTGAAGLSVCYIAQTEQGGAVSQPSNVAGPFVVPASPGAPSTPNGTVADMVQPSLPPTGNTPGPVLTASIKSGK